jgi:hypothetical protein
MKNNYENLEFMLRLMNDLDNAFYKALMMELVDDYIIEAINKPDSTLKNPEDSDKLSMYDQVLAKALDLEEKEQDGFKYIEKYAKKLGNMTEFISNSISPQLADICKEYNISGFENA